MLEVQECQQEHIEPAAIKLTHFGGPLPLELVGSDRQIKDLHKTAGRGVSKQCMFRAKDNTDLLFS